ncbi:hypothetical protein [Dactylosporangium sp. CA-233914]|uniref:hypothetical protein n=1 Tax=Dactylosporangium sp. CA-233914 TaxID=3239934 RepID=UPI003D93375D
MPAFLRTNLTHAELAVANATSTATCRRIINEGIDLLAGRAIRLSEAARPARKAGWEYLLIDGVNAPTVALARRQRRYSGKHKRHRGERADPRRPAAVGLGRPTRQGQRHHRRPPPPPSNALGPLGVLGYPGLDGVATGFRRPRGGQLTLAQQAAN